MNTDINHWFNELRKDMKAWLKRKYPRLHIDDQEEVVQDAMVTLERKRQAGVPLEELRKLMPIVLTRRCCDNTRKNVRYQDRNAPIVLAERVCEPQGTSIAFAVFEMTGLDLSHEEIQFVTALHAFDDPLQGLDLSTPQRRRKARDIFWQITHK